MYNYKRRNWTFKLSNRVNNRQSLPRGNDLRRRAISAVNANISRNI